MNRPARRLSAIALALALVAVLPGAVTAETIEITPIHVIQGSGSTTPLAEMTVTIEGIVVGDFQGDEFGDPQLRGFYVQEEEDDHDDDPATSEGIFVFAPGAPDVAVGDLVRVTGRAGEFGGQTQLSSVSEVVVVSHGHTVTPIAVSLPVPNLLHLERYEGMLVTFPQDLYISEFFNFDRFGEIVLTTSRQFQGTQVAEPGAPALAVAQANALARITLDDGRNTQNPDPAIHPNGQEFTLTNTFRGGDILQDVTGALGEGFGRYRIHPTQGATYLPVNPRPDSPKDVGGDVKVATFNVLNFFTHLNDRSTTADHICGPTGNLECRGANTPEELVRQLDKLVAGIIALDADVVGIQEVENDILPPGKDGNRAHDAVLTLVEALNEAEGRKVWAWVGRASHYNDYPVRNEIIYRRTTVRPVGQTLALADPAFDRVRPGDIEPVGRPPLAQRFRPLLSSGSPEPFAVVVNHFKSKGSPCDSIGDPDADDGQGNCNLTRVAQAEALLDFVAELEEGSSGVLVIGDLNSYAMEDPIRTLEAGGLVDLVGRDRGAEAYTFVFDGQLGTLDYVMSTESLLDRVTGVTVFLINADEPDILDYDMTFKRDAQDALYEPLPYRVSDHDPVIVGLELEGVGRRR